MKKNYANSFTARAYRVESSEHKLLKSFDNFADAQKFAALDSARKLYRHQRPAGGCEGTYQLMQVTA